MAIKTGLKPRDLVWVMQGRLAVSSRIGGNGIEHRPVRRQEEIIWLLKNDFTAVVSMMPNPHNLEVYKKEGLIALHAPMKSDYDMESAQQVFSVLQEALADAKARVLLHRDLLDNTVAGILAGYLIFAGLEKDRMEAVRLVESLMRRRFEPQALQLIPESL